MKLRKNENEIQKQPNHACILLIYPSIQPFGTGLELVPKARIPLRGERMRVMAKVANVVFSSGIIQGCKRSSNVLRMLPNILNVFFPCRKENIRKHSQMLPIQMLLSLDMLLYNKQSFHFTLVWLQVSAYCYNPSLCLFLGKETPHMQLAPALSGGEAIHNQGMGEKNIYETADSTLRVLSGWVLIHYFQCYIHTKKSMTHLPQHFSAQSCE